MTESTGKTSYYSWYALGLLMFVYILNFLDRTIIYILFPLIKKEMVFSDMQLALLGSTSFVIFYTVLGIPFGRIADRGSRKKLIAIGVVVWSVFSGLTGFANDFWTIFLCRVMVGVGEATLGPAAISLLSDYFPPAKRATVVSIYSMGIAIGAGFALIFGGYLSQFGWREAFFIVGFPGLVFGIMVYFLREPARTIGTTASADTPGENSSWRKLVANPAFILLCVGYGLFGLAANNMSIWGTTFYNRVYGVSIPNFGFWTGVLTLAAGIPATLLGGIIADRFRRKRRGGRMYFGAILALVSIPCWLILLATDNFAAVFPVGFITIFAGLSWLGAAAADATEISGVNLRGIAVAIYFFTVNIFAYLIGANIIGKVSDILGGTANPEMLRYALLLCPLCCLLGAICLWLGGKTLDHSTV